MFQHKYPMGWALDLCSEKLLYWKWDELLSTKVFAASYCEEFYKSSLFDPFYWNQTLKVNVGKCMAVLKKKKVGKYK